jgi:Ca-activated chloride channel family protein
MYNYEKTFQLSLASTQEKKDLIERLASTFNASGYKLENGQFIHLHPYFYDGENVIRGALGRDFPVICPSSTFEIYDLESQWQERYPDSGTAVSHSFAFAASPVVFAFEPGAARQLGYPERPIGWWTLQMVASELRDMKVIHAHGRTGDGALIAAAEFIAGMDRPHRPLDVYDERVISFVRSIEMASSEYGPSDQEVLSRAISSDGWRASVIIAQERNVLRAFAEVPQLEAILVYPKEGTIWADHPLALISAWDKPEIRQAYEILRQHMSSDETERELLHSGFHSAQSERLGSEQEVQQFYRSQSLPVQNLQAVSYGASPMVLPGINVVRTIKKRWIGVKKPADVCLVIDISGSMSSQDKLPKVQAGVKDFLDMFGDPSSNSQISLITFASRAQEEVALSPLSMSRPSVETAVSYLVANGETALFDAVLLAAGILERDGNPDHIKAIMALTDGQENGSRANLQAVIDTLRKNAEIIFCGIAYGKDAHRLTLEKMAAPTNGIVVDSDPTGIQMLFQELATRV